MELVGDRAGRRDPSADRAAASRPAIH